MIENPTPLQILARNSAVSIRLSGLILSLLVDRQILTNEQAAAFVEDCLPSLGPDSLGMDEVFRELAAQFRKPRPH